MAEATEISANDISIEFSDGLAAFLGQQDISVAFTSYQTGRLYFMGCGPDDKLALHEARYPQAMGLAGDANRLYLGTFTQIVRLENILEPGKLANSQHDRVFVPRNFQTTGHVDIHELGICSDINSDLDGDTNNNGRIIFVNTAYNCLAEPSMTHSFKSVWKPEFIDGIHAEDRCHLNGLAMAAGKPKYVTAAAASNSANGWRDHRRDGGIIIDVENNHIIAKGLSMPHSPRLHDDALWMLNSGLGEIATVDIHSGRITALTFCPGFLRGLAFHGSHLFTTLSKPRNGRFDKLDLGTRLSDAKKDPWCGVQIRDTQNGALKHWVRFDGAISELFDICILPGVRSAVTIGPDSKEIARLVTVET